MGVESTLHPSAAHPKGCDSSVLVSELSSSLNNPRSASVGFGAGGVGSGARMPYAGLFNSCAPFGIRAWHPPLKKVLLRGGGEGPYEACKLREGSLKRLLGCRFFFSWHGPAYWQQHHGVIFLDHQLLRGIGGAPNLQQALNKANHCSERAGSNER